MPEAPEVIVVGGGHAGAEAAWTSARLGVPTILVTLDASAIGRMSCNPAMGGIAKGQIIREVDALGGLMGLATDAAGIHFRVLNRRKGPAVWAPRAQCDRSLYAAAVQQMLAATPNLKIIEGRVDAVETEQRAGNEALGVRAVRLGDGRRLPCRCVVLTTGTFMRGLMHCGERQTRGGRLGEGTADGLSRSLQELGLQLGRLKTGTPPRVARDSIDFDSLDRQAPDAVPSPFSFLNDGILQSQLSCWITNTNEDTHELIRANLDRAPMYSGQVKSRGPRYCPSIEDKVVRFAEKTQHQVFLEPEGYDSDRLYCNGISTSLPADVQTPMVRSIPGLHRAVIVQFGYAVEYDYVPPQQVQPTLETKRVRGLFLAGQINGTSGYEEAAGQGIVAGLNAARRLFAEEPIVVRRDQGYIGVMIDDLVTRGTVEPYRMFTSRAEYRLQLRSDNADARLTPLGREAGLVDDVRWSRFRLKTQAMKSAAAWTSGRRQGGKRLLDWLVHGDCCGDATLPTRHHSPDVAGANASRESSDLPCDGPLLWDAATIARSTAASWFEAWKTNLSPDLTGCHDTLLAEAMAAVCIHHKYRGYISRQEREVERFRRMEARRIPDGFDFGSIAQLRLEAREKLSAVAPRSIGQARRISGINPADLTVLMIHLETRFRG